VIRSGFVDHLRLTVSDIESARAFYDPLMRSLGFAAEPRDDGGLAWGTPDAGGRTQWLILSPATRGQPHDPRSPGLHHVAFNARDREHVDHVHAVLLTRGAEILDPPGEYADEPDHYAVFFRDPDGLKLEVLHVDEATGPP
jgi:catechol 2,3-dioxygenase-like lactoylglutathione lyase family enzyme